MIRKVKVLEPQKYIESFEGLKYIDTFQNEHGERYAVYKIRGLPYLYVTGDELEWELGLLLDIQNQVLTKDFHLNEIEWSEISLILENFNEASETTA